MNEGMREKGNERRDRGKEGRKKDRKELIRGKEEETERK